jgi:SAM-dependent methyltransferase
MQYEDCQLDEDYQVLTGDSPYQRWLLAAIEDQVGNRVLEVGSGVGGWGQHLTDKEVAVSIDISEERLEIAKNLFKETNIEYRKMDICSTEVLKLVSYDFDTILCVNTLEHIEDDSLALKNMFKVLAAGGNLLLIVPAMQLLYGTLDHRYGHYRRYSKEGLSQILREAGLKIHRISHMNMVGALGWFLYCRVLKIRKPPIKPFGLFNRLVAVNARVDKMFGPPLGMSLVVVASK